LVVNTVDPNLLWNHFFCS